MSTWTSSKVVISLIFGLVLSACDEGGEGFAFLPKAGQETTQADKPRRNVALVRADMMRGQVSLVPADGFCIDKRSLKQNSAVLARCDSLGGKGGAQDAPLGLILVSVAQSETQETPETLLSGLIPPGITEQSREAGPFSAVAHLRGPADDGIDPQHWRAVARIGDHVLSFVGLGPDGGAFASGGGGAAIGDLITRTQAETLAKTVSAETAPESTTSKKGLGRIFKGLFD